MYSIASATCLNMFQRQICPILEQPKQHGTSCLQDRHRWNGCWHGAGPMWGRTQVTSRIGGSQQCFEQLMLLFSSSIIQYIVDIFRHVVLLNSMTFLYHYWQPTAISESADVCCVYYPIEPSDTWRPPLGCHAEKCQPAQLSFLARGWEWHWFSVSKSVPSGKDCQESTNYICVTVAHSIPVIWQGIENTYIPARKKHEKKADCSSFCSRDVSINRFKVWYVLRTCGDFLNSTAANAENGAPSDSLIQAIGGFALRVISGMKTTWMNCGDFLAEG